jgi:hypothetical protein
MSESKVKTMLTYFFDTKEIAQNSHPSILPSSFGMFTEEYLSTKDQICGSAIVFCITAAFLPTRHFQYSDFWAKTSTSVGTSATITWSGPM